LRRAGQLAADESVVRHEQKRMRVVCLRRHAS
jgi:hypothetical protein